MECVAVSGRGNWQTLSCACGLAKFSNDRDFVALAKHSTSSVSGRGIDSLRRSNECVARLTSALWLGGELLVARGVTEAVKRVRL